MNGIVLKNEAELRAHFASASKEEIINEMVSLLDAHNLALRRARSNGMREAAKLIDNMKASKLWVSAIRIKASEIEREPHL